MGTRYKSNDNAQTLGDVRNVLPLPPKDTEKKLEMEIYARFMRHLRLVPNSRIEIKILSAIQFTADLLNESDAYISKVLVDLGMRAPRKAFPASYLEFIDKSNMRSCREVGGLTVSAQDLCSHWHYIGEDRFAAIRYAHHIAEQTYFVET